METFIYKGKLELYNGKMRRFEFDSNDRTLDSFVVMEMASKTLKVELEDVLDLESYSIVTTHPSMIDE